MKEFLINIENISGSWYSCVIIEGQDLESLNWKPGKVETPYRAVVESPSSGDEREYKLSVSLGGELVGSGAIYESWNESSQEWERVEGYSYPFTLERRE